jgi:hypothetical protein
VGEGRLQPGITGTGYELPNFAIRREAPDFLNRAALLFSVTHRAVDFMEAPFFEAERLSRGEARLRRPAERRVLDSLSASEHLVSKRKDGALCRSAAHVVAAARRGAACLRLR